MISIYIKFQNRQNKHIYGYICGKNIKRCIMIKYQTFEKEGWGMDRVKYTSKDNLF